MELTIVQLAKRLGAELAGNSDRFSSDISAVSTVEAAGEGDVTFITSPRHIAGLKNCYAGAVIVAERIEGLAKPQLIVKNVETALIKALGIFAPTLKPVAEGIDPTAKIGPGVRIAKGVAVGAGVVIDDGVEIGADSVIAAGCKIGQNSKLGRNCRFDSNVVVYHNCRLGNSVIVQANSTIGSTGFGYYIIDGAHRLIPHNGVVVIEDFVEIGANCCIDRAKFGETRIGAGTKIDNLVHIAHNVVVGKCCLIAGQSGLGGSCRLGDGVVLGGQVGVKDNIEVEAGTMVGAASCVWLRGVASKQLFGNPAIDKREQLRLMNLTRRLPELVEQLKQLSARIERLESSGQKK